MKASRVLLASWLGFLSSVVLLPVALASQPNTHDGFFFRGGLGIDYGYLSEEVTYPGSSLETKAYGFGMNLELLFGGTITDGFVLGGGLIGNNIINPTIEVEGTEFETDDATLSMSTLGLFANYYLDPRSGFYLQGLVGYGGLTVRVEDETRNTDVDGLVLGAGVGYDFWIGSEWSMGPSFRFTYGILGNHEGDAEASDTMISPSLSLAFTYH